VEKWQRVVWNNCRAYDPDRLELLTVGNQPENEAYYCWKKCLPAGGTYVRRGTKQSEAEEQGQKANARWCGGVVERGWMLERGARKQAFADLSAG
jgi:hypothetical protein